MIQEALRFFWKAETSIAFHANFCTIDNRIIGTKKRKNEKTLFSFSYFFLWSKCDASVCFVWNRASRTPEIFIMQANKKAYVSPFRNWSVFFQACSTAVCREFRGICHPNSHIQLDKICSRAEPMLPQVPRYWVLSTNYGLGDDTDVNLRMLGLFSWNWFVFRSFLCLYLCSYICLSSHPPIQKILNDIRDTVMNWIDIPHVLMEMSKDI